MSDSEYDIVAPKKSPAPIKKTSRKPKASASASSPTSSEKRRRSSSVQRDGGNKKKAKTHDIFGLSHGGGNEENDGAITSYFMNRVANGSERRTANLDGEYVVELKIYRAEDVTDTDPKDLWRKALLRVKVQTPDNSDQWKMLQKLVTSVDKLFDEDPHFYSNKININ